jgi:CubicO group peptidase (beta-lactamase class C family)
MSPRSWITLFSVLLLPVPTPARADGPAVSVKAIEDIIVAEMARQKVPGVAVAVIHKGEPLLAKGYGLANVEHAVPVTADTVFQSGSVGKQFTAAAVLLLVEDGKLSLDDPVTKYLPDAPWRWHAIRIRHLLAHTSGIPDYEDTRFDFRRDYTEDELARYAFGLTPEFEPGARWSYSNTGYVLLGHIVRKASGKFYGDVLRDRVFGPAGMASARVISEADIVPHRAAGYRLVNGQLKNQDWVSPSLNTTADGSLYLSVRDLVAWDTAVRRRAVLSDASWSQAFSPAALRSGKTYPYGCGWAVDDDRGQRRHHHGGAWQGFKAYIARYLADDLTVIVLANLAAADCDAFVDGIAALFNPTLAPPTAAIPDQDPAVTKRVRQYLKQARDGKLPADEFAYVRAGFLATAAEGYQKLLGPLGDPDRLDLIEYRERGDDRFFRYRAAYGPKVVEVWLGLVPDDKVSAFSLREIKGR